MAKNLNRRLLKEAKRYIVGGVNSPVRSFRAVGGEPIFIESACGSKIYSEDGREFIDYCQSFGALILGHSHLKVVDELRQAVNKGTSFATPTKKETELAKLIIKGIPSIQRIRFTNSGTEAVMAAVRLARAYTKKNKIIKFSGSYHGHADYLLDGRSAPGELTKDTLVLPYNDIIRLKEAVRRHNKDIAAIVVEPVAANMGVILPRKGFLEALRRLTEKYNIVLIFDEVITGFRLTFGGAQNLFEISPDLTCLGKIVGGGLPVGAFGGRHDIMRLLSPEGDVYQAGTFSGNPLTVNAGLATLKILSRENPYPDLKEKARELCEAVKRIAAGYGIRIKINFSGSIFSIFFTDKEVTDYNSAKTQDTDLFKRFFHGLLKEGVYLSPSGLEANFISTAHADFDIEKTQEAVDKVFKKIKKGAK